MMDNVVAYRGTLELPSVYTPPCHSALPSQGSGCGCIQFCFVPSDCNYIPKPATGDTGIAEIGNIVVGDFIITAVEDNDTYSRGENVPAMLYDVVVQYNMMCHRLAPRDVRGPYFYATTP